MPAALVHEPELSRPLPPAERDLSRRRAPQESEGLPAARRAPRSLAADRMALPIGRKALDGALPDPGRCRELRLLRVQRVCRRRDADPDGRRDVAPDRGHSRRRRRHDPLGAAPGHCNARARGEARRESRGPARKRPRLDLAPRPHRERLGLPVGADVHGIKCLRQHARSVAAAMPSSAHARRVPIVGSAARQRTRSTNSGRNSPPGLRRLSSIESKRLRSVW